MEPKTVAHALGAVTALLIPSLLWDRPLLALPGVSAVAVGVLALYRDRVLYSIFVVVGILGAAVEVVTIHFGAWTYARPQALGIPVWLPVLWGIAGVTVVRIERKMTAFIA